MNGRSATDYSQTNLERDVFPKKKLQWSYEDFHASGTARWSALGLVKFARLVRPPRHIVLDGRSIAINDISRDQWL